MHASLECIYMLKSISELTGRGIINPEKTFHNAKNAAAMIAAMSALGVTATVIIPKRVKYNRVKNVKNTYQKNFTTVHSNPIIA